MSAWDTSGSRRESFRTYEALKLCFCWLTVEAAVAVSSGHPYRCGLQFGGGVWIYITICGGNGRLRLTGDWANDSKSARAALF
jgi:hypothetical protein